MPPRTALGAWLVVFVLACSPAPTGSPPSPTGAPSARPSSSAALVSPSARPSDTPPPSVAPTAVPSATSSPPATPIPFPVLDPEEEAVASWLRDDVRVDCRPRREDLPDDALLGAECFPRDELVARVGIYMFATEEDAVLAYLGRMSAAGVEPDTGGCLRGLPGDTQWSGRDPEDRDTGPNPGSILAEDGRFLSAYRSGCFHDEDGAANFRTTCGDGVYIGVLGRTRDIGALTEWATEYPDDTDAPAPGSPPGICPYDDGLGADSEEGLQGEYEP